MTCTTNTRSQRRLSAKLALGLAVSAVLVLGTFATSASAQPHRGGDRRGGQHRVYRGGPPRGNWNGGYYPAPPVVYGSPYYYPPPVVYGPGININVPGVSIGIQ